MVHWVETLLRDAGYGLRSFGRTPALTLAVVLTLVLGIGLNAAVFSVINGFFFRPRVEKDPDSFVQLIAEHSGDELSRRSIWSSSLAEYAAYRSEARSVTGLAGWAIAFTSVNAQPDQELALLVTCDFFSLYGLEHPAQGRLFAPSECSPAGSAPAVVISEELWRRKFAANPSLLGSPIQLNRRPYIVVGIVPARFPGRLRGPGIWIPYTRQADFAAGRDLSKNPDQPWLAVEGRLRDGYTRSQAEAELNAIAARRNTRLTLGDGSFFQQPGARGQAVLISSLFVGSVGLVLLLACNNVVTLLLSRGAARRQEISIRLALGASRGRLLRMLLTEGVILAGFAGVLSGGLIQLVPLAVEKLLTRAPYYPVRPDWTVFGFLAGVTFLAGCVAGVAPAIESFKSDLTPSLKRDPGFLRHGRRKWLLRDVLIAGQVAASLVLITGAAIFVRTQRNAFDLRPGLEPQQLLILGLGTTAYTPESRWSFYRTLEQRVRQLPAVVAAGYSFPAPFNGPTPETIRPPDGPPMPALMSQVSPGFLDALRIEILKGRGFSTEEQTSKSPETTVVSETLARTLWPHQDPLGQSIETSGGDRLRVIGVARDAGLARFGGSDGPLFYRLQRSGSAGGPLLVRFHGDAEPVTQTVSAIVAELDPQQAGVPQTLDSASREMASRFSVISGTVLFLGMVAMLMAMAGVYGVVSFAAGLRQKELAIRSALGATRAEIIRALVAPGIRPVLAGLAAGLVLSAVGASILTLVLARGPVALKAGDPSVYLAMSVMLIFASLAAMLRPALRAAGEDPARALRED